MEYRILGRTGIKVSVIGIGGEGLEGKSPSQCEELIDCALANGLNFIDIYNSNPEMRSNVGNAFRKYKRESYVIEGHLCSLWENGQYRRTRNINETKCAFRDLLERLQTNYIDVGMIHYCDDLKDFNIIMNGEVIEYAKELKADGIIKCIGMSTHNPDVAIKCVESGLIDVILFSINPAYDMLPPSEDVDVLFDENTFKDITYEGIEPKRSKLYSMCESKGVALTVMKGFAAGTLFDEKTSPFEKAMTPAQCIHYCLTRPGVASVMAGIKNKDEIISCSNYCSTDEKDRDYSFILSEAPKSSFNGHCMYCGHCAPCTKSIDIASVNKYLDLALMQENTHETLRDHYNLLPHHAGECIQCGACIKNCPFGVNIIDKMKQAEKLFGV